ncbi:SRC kinase signaling inhibitor 1 [Macaca thibetana thibetana]|uniref:SRC kinase signaling inhibitor 1 n=1 Tax=Macaca thibetana thibetana TaxID=257877 RepID=UPI0021BCE4A8|nr:SRC kinase signaling inhibitor 1 [Macaca thibetana thibetana]
MQPWQCLRRFALAWWERTAEGRARSPREEAGPRDPGGRGEPDPERSSPPMLSADDAEYPREYRTLGGGGGGGSGGRRFSNVGLVHTSERRHTVIAAQSLEALSGLQKADADRKRDAFMDHLKSKYPQHALALRGQQDRMREQQPNYWSFKTRSSRHTQDEARNVFYELEDVRPPAQGVSPSPSAILERRDVKPDEDLAGKAGGMVLVKGEGLYADPYGLLHEGRLSLAAAAGDPFAYPGAGGLYKRGSVRSLSTYSAAALQSDLEDSLYKAAGGGGGPLYGDGYGFRLPPSSPQKLADVAGPPGGPPPPHSPYSGPPSRGSPVRQSFRKDSGSSSVFAESPGGKTRSAGSASTAGAPPSELFPGPGERSLVGFGPPVPAKDTETRERMEAMEKQIASLTGLVQSALLRGSEPETPSEKIEGSNGAATPSAPCGSGGRSSGATPVSGPPPPSASSTPAGQPTAVSRLQMQLHLRGLQNSASDLRGQLQQLRKLQLQNQESVRALLKRTEAELSMRVSEAARRQEDPLQRQRTLVEEERLRYLNDEELITQQLNDLEKSVEKIQRDVSHNHRLVPGPELEEKALLLKQLGETLTELKAHFPGLQSKMRVVLRVEVEAVKFLKEEPQRLDGLLKRCRGVTDTLAQIRRQVDEGVWPPPNNLLSQSPKKVTAETDFNKSVDFEMPPPSPPLNLHELSGPAEGASLTPKGSNPTKGLDTPGKRSVDKAVSVEAAERDWEEKRAALTQYSAKDINRLLEETQAELLKAIPDLDCASKAHPGPAPTPDHKPPKAPHGQKAAPRTEPSGRRGSDELTVPRYRTEKPSKSPPPPPPRRSFPSSHGLTTTRTGEVVVTSKKDSAFIKKAESEELEVQKPQVKLRRAVSEVARPASTPPIMASAIKDEDDEDRIIAELESGGGSVPPMKVVTPGASRLKAAQGQVGSPDKSKHGKQRAEYMRIQAQQQATKPSKEMSGSNETSSPVSEKPSASRTSIPVLTSFGARNSSISF